MKEPQRHQVMIAEMRPDIYGGKNCDEHIPQWWIYAEGDMDSDTTLGPVTLYPSEYPPGTQIIIKEPFCPKCEMLRHNCNCGFDWRAWVEEKYS